MPTSRILTSYKGVSIMLPAGALVRLRHGTTHSRAARILDIGPDPEFIDPGGDRTARAEGFSTTFADAPDQGLGRAEDYARMKARNFPAEGGPVVVEIEVPTDLLNNTVLGDAIGRIAAESGDVRFEPGLGLEELIRTWPTLPKRIIVL
jgi:hypothetical protein